jgi:hypothetical protein
VCYCNSLYLTQYLPGKLKFYGRILNSRACVAFACKAVDEIRNTFFFKSFGANKINKLVVTSNKLTNSFAELVKGGLGPDVGRQFYHIP